MFALAILLSVSGAIAADEAVEFRFQFPIGDQYRIVGTNRQTITVDGAPAGTADTLTRVAVEVVATGRLDARYEISEDLSPDSGEPWQLARSDQTIVVQDELGRHSLPADAFLPQVRNVPTFPEEAIAPGARWSAPAEDVFDFREGFEVADPVRVGMNVDYEYVGPVERAGRPLHHIRARYALFFRSPRGSDIADHLRVLTGSFDQSLYWDAFVGRAHAYEESYTLFLQLADGTRVEYIGVADGEIIDAEPLDRAAMQADIATSIEDEGIVDATVRETEDGVTIAFENIRFAPDSAELLPGELPKLDWLARILERYPDRDVLITGHTALAGTAEGRQVLSEERAATVGSWLIESGVRTRDTLMFRGLGAREPVAPNDTEAGRARNRRVEITILEN